MRALGFRLVRSEDEVRRDPAPSRWHYRWQRLMLTPLFRATMRVGVPAFLLVFLAGAWVSNDANRARLTATWDNALATIQNRPEFQVAELQIIGASPAVAAAVDDLIDIAFPVSSFDLDLGAIRDKVADLTAVRDVRVGIGPDGTLDVVIEERAPVAVWRYGDSLRLIDAEGVMTGMIVNRSDRADLPLIAGDGARASIAEALTLFAAASPIAPRVRALVRMGERRWDMVLDRDQRILLPETGAVAALERVIAWQEAQEMLDRDVLVVDLRDADRPTLRLSRSAMNILNNTDVRAASAQVRDIGTGEE